ncbi:type I-F CRISPR-associated protein Csy2 [Methylomonas sp. MgM2]
MSDEYVLLPRLEIQNANAQSAWWLINAAPVMAANLFAHNLGRHCRRFPRAVGIFHHHGQLLGERFYRKFHPQQRRGAVFIDGADYASTNKHALSLQPTASCHLTWSLLLAFSVDDGLPSLTKVHDFLHGARLAGGQIIRHEPAEALNDVDAVKRRLRGGFWLVERRDLLENRDPLDGLIAACGLAKQKADETEPGQLPASWLTPTTLGYAAITDFAQRGGVRDGYPHAYAEPLIGLAQYVSPRHWGERPLPLWRGHWPQDDVFIVTQQEINP